MPIVSIVLPTFNRGHLIRKSIETCLGQTLQDIELIIVNDCSVDNTASILDEYKKKDSRVKVIHNETNLKLPASLNRGFEMATGKYFTWTSDDNLYTSAAMETMVKALEDAPEKGLVYANCMKIDEAGDTFGSYILEDINKSFMLWKGCGACFLYKAEIHTFNKGYDATLFLVEDYDFFIRAWLKYQFIYLPQTDLYFYRYHPDSLGSINANAVFELSKIRVEKLQELLFSKFSKYDKMIFYRKYAVYYGVLKNNLTRTNHYLNLLWKASKKNYCITFGYIIFKKMLDTFVIAFGMVAGFFKALFK